MNLFQSTISHDPLFVRLRDDVNLADQRGFVNALYDLARDYTDRDFPSQFPVQCLSRFWEIYLACALIDLGLKLVPRKELPKSGPDFCVKHDESVVWIEAVTPNIGSGADSTVLAEDPPTDQFQQVPEDEIVLRFASAIKDKYDYHLQHINKRVVSPEEPFLVAVNGGAIPLQFWDSNTSNDVPYAIQAVLPFGHYSVTIDRKTMQVVNEGFEHRSTISKLSGSPVPTNTFLNSTFGLLAGLLFTNAHPVFTNRVISNQVSLLRNYSATHQIPERWEQIGIQWWIEQHQDKYELHHRRNVSAT